jgi:hypothetical protein
VGAPARRSWHDYRVLVVFVILALLIVGGAAAAATGRGGELARHRGEGPASTDFRTWSDVAGYRPPPALLGYHAATTEHALSLIARTIAERDAEIAWLRSRLAEAAPPPVVVQQSAGDAAAQPSAPQPGDREHEMAHEPVLHTGFTAQQAPEPPPGDEA